ncbi:MAG: carboxypeptidase-like regulatory domain-containing protein [Acidobacteria bacterium]|nr:carboxypeptidase-like regulatory domain-containing protein [Acidobacteriota bacterium]
MTRILGFALVALLMLPATVLAQITAEGSIRGVVRDEQGAVLPGVTITAMSPAAPRPVTAVSDAEGVYRLQNLLPGDYVIVAELQGFSRNERGGVVVTAGLNLTIDVSLKIGTLDETIQVTAEAPMLETESSSKAVNISGDLQRSLPLTSRKDFSDFLEVTPGVTARGFDQASGGQVYIVLERFHVAQRLG